jgi:hypothetical protein
MSQYVGFNVRSKIVKNASLIAWLNYNQVNVKLG